MSDSGEGPGAGPDAELPDEDAPWADGPGHLDGEQVPPPEEVAALGDPPPAEEVPPSPS